MFLEVRLHRQEKSYRAPLGEGARKRIKIVREGQKILDYMVQLEVQVSGEWKPVVRYDPADRGPHCDIMRLDGAERDEEYSFPFDITTGYKEALQHADEDIRRNWRVYKENFLKGKWPK